MFVIIQDFFNKNVIAEFISKFSGASARYYNPRISLFYAKNPLAEKYSGFSPYTYTADNPVMLADPTGMAGEMYDWQPVKRLKNVWKAEKGDSAATLAKDANVSYEVANKAIQEQFGQNIKKDGKEYSRIKEGNVVQLPYTIVEKKIETTSIVYPENYKENLRKIDSLSRKLEHIEASIENNLQRIKKECMQVDDRGKHVIGPIIAHEILLYSDLKKQKEIYNNINYLKSINKPDTFRGFYFKIDTFYTKRIKKIFLN